MADKLILVDGKDKIIGYGEKEKCHDGDGKLHRAFSIFLFNSNGQMLIQKRALDKRLWGGYWTNSVCSHPRKGETYKRAAERRLKEELGISTKLKPLFKFKYQARFGDAGSEHEMDRVFVGVSDKKIRANPDEISEWKFVDTKRLLKDAKARPNKYTPWFKIALERVVDSQKRAAAKKF